MSDILCDAVRRNEVPDEPVRSNAELRFGLEKLRDIQPDVTQLWQAHYDETEGYTNTPMRPALDQFYRMEDCGMFREFTARANGKLVGHIGYIVHIDRHTSVLSATEDYFYLDKNYRTGFNAMRFLMFAVKHLKLEGCRSIGMSSKLTNDIEPLLRRAGFKFVAKLFIRDMKE